MDFAFNPNMPRQNYDPLANPERFMANNWGYNAPSFLSNSVVGSDWRGQSGMDPSFYPQQSTFPPNYHPGIDLRNSGTLNDQFYLNNNSQLGAHQYQYPQQGPNPNMIPVTSQPQQRSNLHHQQLQQQQKRLQQQQQYPSHLQAFRSDPYGNSFNPSRPRTANNQERYIQAQSQNNSFVQQGGQEKRGRSKSILAKNKSRGKSQGVKKVRFADHL